MTDEDDQRFLENFNPRSPRGERPKAARDEEIAALISIHAPREGSDTMCKGLPRPLGDFNPRSPRGERQQYCTDIHDPNGNIATRLPNEACLRDEKHRFEPKKVI